MDLYSNTGGITVCLLCPHQCRIKEGRTGICGVRRNEGGRVVPESYGVISGLATDPIEKKPLYHFFPGYKILSAGSYGCNMSCDFCQNHTISQDAQGLAGRRISPDQLASLAAAQKSNLGLAFTYNEPVIWFEFMRDTAEKIREAGMYTVMVSNGYVNPGPLSEITGFIDAFNIDLKAFSDSFYRKLTGAALEPVLSALKQIAAAGRHLEITTLVVPGMNDTAEEMKKEAEWIAGELGSDIPLHLSRYFPNYRRTDPPTSGKTLETLALAAGEYLSYVYTGNVSVSEHSNTRCPQCGSVVTSRTGYQVTHVNTDGSGKCRSCGFLIYRAFRPGLP